MQLFTVIEHWTRYIDYENSIDDVCLDLHLKRFLTELEVYDVNRRILRWNETFI